MTERTYLLLRGVCEKRQSSMAAIVGRMIEEQAHADGVMVSDLDVERAQVDRKKQKASRAAEREDFLRDEAHRLRSGGL